MTPAFYYRRFPSALGEVGLVWTDCGRTDRPRIRRILLPGPGDMAFRIEKAFPGAAPRAHPRITAIADRIRRGLAGVCVAFSPDEMDLEACGPFQRQVLRLQSEIPRGRVSTYGALAGRLGHPGAARAVGTALARNPFPLVIPCHRTIRADRSLGEFGGGRRMKRKLLETEGVRFDPDGRVARDCVIR